VDRVAPGGLLRSLMPLSDRYMHLPIREGFNWPDFLADVGSGEWYLVVFRSKHRGDADKILLYEQDERALLAARRSPGFVYYFAGAPDSDGFCMSFCLWHDQQCAQLASRHQAHQMAQGLAPQMYEYFTLERYRVHKSGEEGLTFTPIHGPMP
jgi:hypothetical protein